MLTSEKGFNNIADELKKKIKQKTGVRKKQREQNFNYTANVF